MNDAAGKRVCLGAFAGAHGVKGATRIKTFTAEPQNVADYGPVETEDGKRRFSLQVIRIDGPDMVLAQANEIRSREDAQALKGVRFYVERHWLPAPASDEFYIEDLIGLNAADEQGTPLGNVAAVHNFGAGDILELRNVPGFKGAPLVPFSLDAVPKVDIESGTVTVQRSAVFVEDEKDGAD